MTGFSNVVMPNVETSRIYSREEMENRIEEPAGILGRKSVSGLKRNYPEPD
jgi:hypothetical protein